MNRKYFSVHEHVSVYIGTDHNVSDFLTKNLQGNIIGSVEDLTRGAERA